MEKKIIIKKKVIDAVRYWCEVVFALLIIFILLMGIYGVSSKINQYYTQKNTQKLVPNDWINKTVYECPDSVIIKGGLNTVLVDIDYIDQCKEVKTNG